MKTVTKLIRTALMGLAVAWFGPSLTARAVTPAPDGGYPNNNTAEGSAALFSLTSGINNTALGARALFTNNTGSYNTATGSLALERNQSGSVNTANGYDALFSNTTGNNNTATGFRALFSNTGATANNRLAGGDNTANGSAALFHNTIGNNNTATGFEALFSNTNGAGNTATGSRALFNNTASNNTATGAGALFSNVGAPGNTADGYLALHDNVGPNPDASPKPDGSENTAVGSQALQHNGKSGNGAAFNTAVGSQALSSNDINVDNTTVGAGALQSNVNGPENTAIGMNALETSTGDNNIALGVFAGQNLVTGNSNIYIGNFGVDGESGTIRLGTDPAGSSLPQTATFIAGIYGESVDAASGVPVQIDSTGKLGTVLSSARFKQAIKPMDKVSEAVLGLEPVTFQYKPELDPKGVPQFGLVAEQVEKIAPQLVVHDKQGKPYTVRYEAVNAMLLNEFLKEHRKVEEQAATIAQMKQQMEALAVTVQKVSEQVAATQPTLVAGN